MKRTKLTAYGTAIALSVPVMFAVYNFMNAPQCPDTYSRAQIEASNCIAGSNIGLGVFVTTAPIIWLVVVFVIGFLISYFFRNKEK